MACCQLDILLIAMSLGEFVKTRSVGVAVVNGYASDAIARNGKRIARHKAHQHLGGPADQLVVIDENMRERMCRASTVVGAQVVYRQIGRFGLGDGLREGKVRLQKLMDVGFLACEQPFLVVVGKFGPAAIEEFQHLAQAFRAQAADFHVLKEKQLLVGGEQAGLAAAPATGLGVGKHVERNRSRRGDRDVAGGLIAACFSKPLSEGQAGLRRCAGDKHAGWIGAALKQMANAVDERLRFAVADAAHDARGLDIRCLSHINLLLEWLSKSERDDCDRWY